MFSEILSSTQLEKKYDEYLDKANKLSQELEKERKGYMDTLKSPNLDAEMKKIIIETMKDKNLLEEEIDDGVFKIKSWIKTMPDLFLERVGNQFIVRTGDQSKKKR